MKRAELLRDIAGISGCASLTAGAAMIHAPSGFIVGGLMLIAGALLTARKS